MAETSSEVVGPISPSLPPSLPPSRPSSRSPEEELIARLNNLVVSSPSETSSMCPLDSRPLLVFDLDGTLITSLPFEKIDDEFALPPLIESFFQDLPENEHKDFTPYFRMYIRPGLKKMFSRLADKYIFAFWSDATEDYVEFIIRNIINPALAEIPKAEVLFIWDKNHCQESHLNFGFRKSFDMIEYYYGIPPSEIYIMENNPAVFSRYPKSTILVSTFIPNDNTDEELNSAITRLE